MATNASGNEALRALHASLASEREWRNIQNAVVTAFGRIVVVLEAQTCQIDAVMSRLERLESSRAKELDAKMEDFRAFMAKETKRSIEMSSEQLMERLRVKIDARLATHAAKMEETMAFRLSDVQKAEHTKREEMEQVIRTQVAKDLDDTLKRGPREDVKLDAVERQLKRLEKNMRVMEKTFTTQWSTWQRELSATLQSKASLDDLASYLETKFLSIQTKFASVSEMEHVKSHIQELQESQTLMNEDMEQVHEALGRLEGAAETEQMKSHIHELLSIVEKMQNEQSALKALTMDHTKQTDQDTDTKHVVLRLHDAVKSVRRSVETVAKRAEMEALSEQVAVIRKQLRSEIYQARYIWKEGRPTAKQTVPWSSQAVNSNADVFVWQRSQQDTVTTMIPGLYHLQAAFFTRFSPTLQVLVNGEPALILTNTEETIEARHGSNQEKKDPSFSSPSISELGTRRRRLNHSAGDLVGVEIAAFLALPARATIAISYDIDERAQGFLNLRKL